jgi:hypothetical protein
MNKEKKIILFEGELKGGKGHHYDHLVENSFYYKNKGEILWVVNKEFNKDNLYIPNYVKIFNIIDTANRKISSKNFLFIIKLLYLSIKNFFMSYYFVFFNLRLNKKLLIYLLKNFFSFPKYFSSFCKILSHTELKEGDKIIFQTSRINEIELAYLLILMKFKVKLHLRIIQLHRKKKLAKFNRILKKLNDKNELYNNVFLYTETDFQKQQIKKLTNIDVELFYNNLSFSKKEISKNKFTIGILGESRFDKGFYKIPDLIKDLNNKAYQSIRFVVQINNCPENLLNIKKELLKLSEEYKNVKLIEGYINFFEYRDLLKTIDIIPLLHELDQLKFCGSGIVFSSMVNEIPMIIPKEAVFVKKFFEFDSFLEAENISEYSDSIIKVVENYPQFLEMAKKQSTLYKNKLNQDPLNNRI